MNRNKAGKHYEQGVAFLRAGRWQQAFAELSLAVRCNSQDVRNVNAMLALAEAYNNQMLFAEAKQCVGVLLECCQHDSLREANLLSLHYNPEVGAEELYEEHRVWGRRMAQQYQPLSHEISGRTRHERLRIGYVSPDFCAHAVACFVSPLLQAHDKNRFQIFCYANVHQPDIITQRLQSNVEVWRDITGMPDQQVVDRILADEIDILVDLAGHTEYNRLSVFARKPAPVQVTWLGYPNTTGLDTMDYRFTDPIADPVGITDQFYSEELFRLPNFLCYLPINSAELGEPPAIRNGFITFASFNKLKKVTPETVALWAAVLQAVPGARLVMKAEYFSHASVRRRVIDMFASHGIEESQLVLLDYIKSHAEHLQAFNQVDIVLDPLRYSGTTSTCEALWMGVPVVTLASGMHVSRVSASLLQTVGLGQLAAGTPEQYIGICCRLAKDIRYLQWLRRNLRQHMEKSPVMNGPLFASHVEAAYQEMWRRWCVGEV